MPKTLRFEIELSDNHVDAIETVKSLLMTDDETGITNETPLERVYAELANVGLAVLSQDMMGDGTWEKHSEEVRLGNDIDSLLNHI